MVSGLQLQFWPCPEVIHVTATALGGIPRELVNHRNRYSYSSQFRWNSLAITVTEFDLF